jgi:hypothetical protein
MDLVCPQRSGCSSVRPGPRRRRPLLPPYGCTQEPRCALAPQRGPLGIQTGGGAPQGRSYISLTARRGVSSAQMMNASMKIMMIDQMGVYGMSMKLAIALSAASPAPT